MTSTCPNCGRAFSSKRAGKKFCTVACYVASPQFKLARERERKPVDNTCARCRTVFQTSSKQRRKFCTDACRRRHYEERFDRFVASPEALRDMQAFDEARAWGLRPPILLAEMQERDEQPAARAPARRRLLPLQDHVSIERAW